MRVHASSDSRSAEALAPRLCVLQAASFQVADIGADLMKMVFKSRQNDAAIRSSSPTAQATMPATPSDPAPTASKPTRGRAWPWSPFCWLSRSHDSGATAGMDLRDARRNVVLKRGCVLPDTAIASAKWKDADEIDFETPLTSLVSITSIVSIALTYMSRMPCSPIAIGDTTLSWKLASIISCGTLAGALIPELVRVTSTIHPRQGSCQIGAGRRSFSRILSGFVAGNFSAYRSAQHGRSHRIRLLLQHGHTGLQNNPAGMMLAWPSSPLASWPSASSVWVRSPSLSILMALLLTMLVCYELSLIETFPNIEAEVKKDFGMSRKFERCKHLLKPTMAPAVHSKPLQSRC